MARSNLGPILLLCALVGGYLVLSYPNVFAYVLMGLLAVAAACTLGMIVYVVYWQMRNLLIPTARVHATVARRRAVPWDVSIPRETTEMSLARLGSMGRHPRAAARALLRSSALSQTPDIEIAAGTDYCVTFLVNGQELEFLVPETAFAEAEEGSSGLLTFRAERFVSFQPSLLPQPPADN